MSVVMSINVFLRKVLVRARQEELVSKAIRIPEGHRPASEKRVRELEELALLGALMDRVARADDEFHPDEEQAMRKALSKRGGLTKDEAGMVLAAAQEASARHLDTHGLTRHVGEWPYEDRLKILELLFAVAAADGQVSHDELEAVRKIAKLLWIAHSDFIAAKIRGKPPAK